MFAKTFVAASLLVQSALGAAVAATTHKNMAYYTNWYVVLSFFM